MIRICMVCDKVFGEKEPLDDNSPTHGICDPCFEEIKVKYEDKENNGTEVGQIMVNYANQISSSENNTIALTN